MSRNKLVLLALFVGLAISLAGNIVQMNYLYHSSLRPGYYSSDEVFVSRAMNELASRKRKSIEDLQQEVYAVSYHQGRDTCIEIRPTLEGVGSLFQKCYPT